MAPDHLLACTQEPMITSRLGPDPAQLPVCRRSTLGNHVLGQTLKPQSCLTPDRFRPRLRYSTEHSVAVAGPAIQILRPDVQSADHEFTLAPGDVQYIHLITWLRRFLDLNAIGSGDFEGVILG